MELFVHMYFLVTVSLIKLFIGFFFPGFFFFFQIPFDVTLESIASLEDMFDPANGCKITEESLFNWIISLFH